jgi:hypothetical protein
MSDGSSFNELREVEESKRKMERAKGTQRSHAIAHFFAYSVGVIAISVLSLIFAQTVSNVFTDPVLKIIGSAGAIAVGASAIVFLIFNEKILRSDEQFRWAIAFVIVELALLTLGSLNAFGEALGWQFAPFVKEIMHVAVIITLPVVGVEWIVVVAILNPDAKAKRAESFAKSKRLEDERNIRDNYRNSDEVMKIRKTAVKAEVIEEEMARLPTSMRPTYAHLLKNEGMGNVPTVSRNMPDVLDMPAQFQTPMRSMNSDGNGQSPKE